MIWDKYKTLTASVDASRLSELLEQEGFFEQGALRWLESPQLNKFLAAIDAAETSRLSRLALSWSCPHQNDSNGFPLLDWLWALDPNYDLKPEYFGTTKNVSSIGRKLVGCLAEFNYKWVARWWEWRCTKGRDNLRERGLHYDYSFDGPANDIVINALAKEDLERCLPWLTFGLVAAVIGRRPDLIETLPEDRRGPVLRLALEEAPKFFDFTGELSKVSTPTDLEQAKVET
jgi:hypothetical protein